MSKDEITPVDQECIDVMYTIESWLLHWSRMLDAPDGPAHVPAFVTSMHDLCHRLLAILEPKSQCRAPDGHRYVDGVCVWCDAEQGDEANEYVPARDGVAH